MGADAEVQQQLIVQVNNRSRCKKVQKWCRAGYKGGAEVLQVQRCRCRGDAAEQEVVV